jgi:hypothetical protein
VVTLETLITSGGSCRVVASKDPLRSTLIMSYAEALKFGKNKEKNAPAAERRYTSFTSRFSNILNDDTTNNSFTNDQEPSLAWSKRYFEALDMPERNNAEKQAKYVILHCIHNDFVAAASTYAKTIISEHYLENWRTLKPVKSIGGHGGEKYLVHGILFKFATGEGQNNEMFEGSDEYAAKAMGHEIKGVNSYIRTGVRLCYALQCLVDYKGFRMHCQAKLDIDNETLRVGTADAGKIVKSEDANLLELMKCAAQELNIREHTVKGLKMYSAGDCEGHQGKDGRYYVVDLARVFPPEFPGCLERLGLRRQPLGLRQTVFVRDGSMFKLARITNVYPETFKPHPDADPSVRYYDIVLHADRTVRSRVPSSDIERAEQCIFWKFLRPEFVKSRGRSLLNRYEQNLGEVEELRESIRRFATLYETKLSEPPQQQSPTRSGPREATHTTSSAASTPDPEVFLGDSALDAVRSVQQIANTTPFNGHNPSQYAAGTDSFELRSNAHLMNGSIGNGDVAVGEVSSLPALVNPVYESSTFDDMYSLARPITDSESSLYSLARPLSDIDSSNHGATSSASGVTPLSIIVGDGALSAAQSVPFSTVSAIPPPPPLPGLGPTGSPKSPRSAGKRIDTSFGMGGASNSSNATVLGGNWMANLKRVLQQPPQPLSSDALSGFGRDDKESEVREFEVKCATKELLFILVPTMVSVYLVE